MRFLWRLGLVAIVIVLVYCLTVPTARVHLRADSYDTSFVQQAWNSASHHVLFLLNKSSILDELSGLPVSNLKIERQRPWDASIDVTVQSPDIVIRQGATMVAVFAEEQRVYAIPRAKSTWDVVDVQGFPKEPEAFCSLCLKYASLCSVLNKYRTALGITAMQYTSSTGLMARLKDGKMLILGDGADGLSKIQRGISVMEMPAFKMRKITIDLRFDGQAVIPEAP